ncbi:hypothetical protein CPB84DRAFT_1843431 [Gymnopilus junonius]|uniref:Uncharacterized protein n=1 Tax=Gymnopilus junonius TaxID=109634 RepID=A0A9P5NXB7_GYMJU|nr:hypothetical protein CPB84DRAFT_1843431 [Gymnopilus junonius]
MAPTSERLFVDLIALATHKYPNWDPEVPIEPGDYGRITSGHRHKSYAGGGGGAGAFWYRNVTLKRRRASAGRDWRNGYGIPLPVEYGGDSTQGTTWITSRNARQVTWDADIAGQHPTLAECSIKASFKFTTGQGAVLAMDNDTVLAINPAGKLLRLLASESQTGTKKETHEMENGKEKEKRSQKAPSSSLKSTDAHPTPDFSPPPSTGTPP